MYPVKELTLNLDYHFFQQTATAASFSISGHGPEMEAGTASDADRGVLIPAGNSGFIGHELICWRWRPEEWLEVAWSLQRILPGAALDGAVIGACWNRGRHCIMEGPGHAGRQDCPQNAGLGDPFVLRFRDCSWGAFWRRRL